MEIGGLLNNRQAVDAQLRQLQHGMQIDSHSYAMGHPQNQLNHQLQDFSSIQQANHNHFSSNYNATAPGIKEDVSMENAELLGPSKSTNESQVKKFICNRETDTGPCPKAFARKSDLARHVRIHTGEKPHFCEYHGCGKSFIQRSALTVHYRVHTGEKPHACEVCDKTFSDSSSLARHRRTHTGRRDFVCPVKTCQKTFTRRTTLTRHSLSHGAEAQDKMSQTSGKLSSTSVSSRATTESPGERTLSVSPGAELPPMVAMQRSNSEHGYLPQPSLPPHLRNDFSAQFLPRSTPSMTGPSLASFTSNPQSKPSPTSHPNAYGPPQPLEPPANGTASGSASPHMGPLSWGSPNHGTLPSPGSLGNYDYPDTPFGGAALYYPGNIRRPQSTEPEDYGIRPRGSHAQALAHAHQAVSMPLTQDWSPMPTVLHDIKQERFVM